MRDWSGIFLGAIVVVLLTVCVALVVVSVQHDKELERAAIACEQNKNTEDYLKCLAPIRAEQKQIQEDAEDAAIVSSIFVAASVATVQ